MVFNNLVFQWYRIEEWKDNSYNVLTPNIAVSNILFAIYCAGETTYKVFPGTNNLLSVIDYFNGTSFQYCFRGGDDKNYIRHGWLLVIGY